MVGNFKLSLIFYCFIAIISCNKKESLTLEGQKLVESNIVIFLDSIEHFDWTKIPINEKFENEKREEFKYELVDSVFYDRKTFNQSKKKLQNHFKEISKYQFLTFKISRLVLEKNNLKKITFSKIKSNDIYTLSIVFSNLIISEKGNLASMMVTKSCGISMTKDIFYFENKNNKWIFTGKENIVIG